MSRNPVRSSIPRKLFPVSSRFPFTASPSATAVSSDSALSYDYFRRIASRTVLKQRLAVLREQAEQTLLQKGFSEDLIFSTEYLNMRYKGTETSIMISVSLDVNGISSWSTVAAVASRRVGPCRLSFSFLRKALITRRNSSSATRRSMDFSWIARF